MDVRIPRARAAAVAAALIGVLAAPAVAPAAPKGKPVTVMTRNLYLGGDIMRPLAAVSGKEGVAALIAFGNANHELRRIVAQTDWPARSRLLAREIATRKPDLVGLQEVALWRRGHMQLDQIGVPNATEVDYDFLKTLLRDLRRRGARYRAVVVQRESDVEGPAFTGADPLEAAGNPASFDARLTMRDVILRRAGSKVKVLRRGGGQFERRISVALGGRTFSFIRGFTYADVRAGARRFRFINTHLESVSSDVALAQAQELLAGVAKPSGRGSTVLVCDCNSDPLDGSVKPADTVGHKAAYEAITAAGYADEWLRFAPAEQGFTSGLSELVNDADTSAIDHRIDMVFARSRTGAPLPVSKGWIVGTDPSNRTASGLWPSDHAGVVLRIRP